MGNYKGISIPDELVGVIDYMDKLEEDREELSVLSQQWDLLTILGQMSGSGTDMTKTREDFKNLTSKLLSVLGVETLNKTVQSITAKAQVAVDIVIRNLFERTADIGFLATDEDIREFVRVCAGRSNDEEAFQLKKKNLQERFSEYVQKYSVYDNIILMGCDGEVLCQLDESNPVIISSDAIIKEALETTKEYVEVFRPSDLSPSKRNALIYGFRVRETNDPGSPVIGVLCLTFRFENELEGVFKNLITEGDWTVLSLLDQQGQVIASSDVCQLPLSSKMELVLDSEFKIAKFAGRLYLSKTCKTKGYQGFTGLGWMGHAMIPLEYAFNNSESESEVVVDTHVLESVMDEPRLFSAELRSIPHHAESIQAELDRTVWNGNLGKETGANKGNVSANKVLLWEISTTGNKTKSVFEKSIRDLHETVVNSILTDVRFVSSLAIDIMDRNLYERANDCRWWALTTDFRSILSDENASPFDLARMSKVLQYINGLYTVYTNLFVFDKNGKVLGVSNSAESHCVGQVLTNDFVRSILSASGSQSYRVSPFQKTDLYQNRPTYIYGASIAHPTDAGSVVGGIGIVFDSEPQFQKIFEDSLPRNEKGQVPEGCYGAFVDRDANIISSTDRKLLVGSKLAIDGDFFQIPNGQELAKIIKFENQYYAVGARCSQGYREFKNEKGGYRNDVIAITMFPLGQVKDLSASKRREQAKNRVQRTARRSDQEYVEIASFYVGGAWLAVKTSEVQGAIIVNKITRMPLENDSIEGTVMFGDRPIYLIHPSKAKGSGRLESGTELQVVVLTTDYGPIGVVVDRLGEIPEIPVSQIVPNQFSMDEKTNYVEGIVRPDSESQDSAILLVLNPTGFIKTVVGSRGSENVLSQFEALGGATAEAEAQPGIKAS